MNDIDFFALQDENSFNFFRFTINLGFSVKSMTLNEFSLLAHEYTHYIQSICTVSGVSLLFKYFSFIKDIYLDINKKICDGLDYDTTYYNLNYFDKYQKLLSLLNYSYDKEDNDNSEDYSISYEFIHNEVYNCDIKEYFISLNHNKYHISYKCLRETMAMMTTFFARKYTVNDILEYYDKNPKIEMYYKILFLYFLKKYNIDDPISFTYYFCEIALQSDKPAQILDLLIRKLNNQPKGACINTSVFFTTFKKDNSRIFKLIEVLTRLLQKEVNSLDILISKYEYFKYAKDYLQRCINGLLYYYNNNSLFSYFGSLSNLQLLASKLYSPVVIEKENGIRKINALYEHNNDYGLVLIWGVSNLLDSYIRGDDTPMHSECIFKNIIPYCDFCDKGISDENICNTKPFYIKPFEDGNCLFYNASLVLGMLPDEEIQKYIKK